MVRFTILLKDLAVTAILMLSVSLHGSAQAPVEKTDITAPLVYEGTMLVLVSDDGVGAVVFRPTARGGAAYDFRYEGKDGARLEGADKLLFESRDPKTGRLGGELVIKAGPLAIGWSRGGDAKGWIYYTPEKVEVHLADARDFAERIERTGDEGVRPVPRIDLQRFVKKP